MIDTIENAEQMGEVIAGFLSTLPNSEVRKFNSSTEREIADLILQKFFDFCYAPDPAIVLPVKALRGQGGKWFISDVNGKYITDLHDKETAETMVKLMNQPHEAEKLRAEIAALRADLKVATAESTDNDI